jgi:alpha-1,3-rhamnosyl/mannosyltransferase
VGRSRLIVTVHDAAPELFPEAFPARGRRFHRHGLRAAARRADLVITVSKAAEAEIAANTPIPVDRVRVVPGGVDLAPASRDEVARTLGRYRLTDAPYVFWLGTLEPRKNVTVLVSAFARLLAGRTDLPHRLVLAGSGGWLEEGLVPPRDEALLRQRDRLRVLGHVPDDELRALYAGAVLFALPSRHEGFGLPVLEAMAQGTPVVCADIAPLREVAGGAARLVPPMDVDAWVVALSDLFDGAEHHPDETTRPMAAAGRARAAGFSWERCIRATHAVYEEAMA